LPHCILVMLFEKNLLYSQRTIKVQKIQYSHFLAYVKHVGRAASLSRARLKGRGRQPEAIWRGRAQLGRVARTIIEIKASALGGSACDTCEKGRGDVDPLPALFRGLGVHSDPHLF
jgi:hypothetical protein